MEFCFFFFFFHKQGHNPEAKFLQQEQARISPGKALQTMEQYQKDPKNSSKKEVSGKKKKKIPRLPYTVVFNHKYC